jgi:hypothetical protein
VRPWVGAALLFAVLFHGGARAVSAAEPSELTFQNVVVRRGDTLWGIANTYLKDPSKWDQVLKYNRLPSNDPTVALPGMTLRVPIQLIKENMRAAQLVYLLNRVLVRRRDTADWGAAEKDSQLFKGDTLHTLENAKAKVKFLNADLLSLDPNSMAVIKPPNVDYDVELKTGAVFTGHARVITASARVTPRTTDTQYSAKVRPDLSTLVEVYKGRAGVEGGGKTVEVPAGMASEVKLGLAPSLPTKIPDLPEFEARAAEFNGEKTRGAARLKVAANADIAFGADADSVNNAADVTDIPGMVKSLRVGVPISGFRVQASRTRDFETLLVNQAFETDARVSANDLNLQPGVYWFRIALIDLLKKEGGFTSARLLSVGLAPRVREIDIKDALVLIKPEADMRVETELYQVRGTLKYDNLVVTVNDRPVAVDEQGNFSIVIKLRAGPNDVAVKVARPGGDSSTIVRRLIYNFQY